MRKNFLNISGVSILSKEQQKNLTGGIAIDLSKCGCDCAGRVTGPLYCHQYFACTQEYTCQEEM